MSKLPIAVFCDFDGTIVRRDVGNALFHHFTEGKCDKLIPAWKSGQISSRECLLREAEMVSASPDEIYTYLDQFEIDPTFFTLVDVCNRDNVPLIIVSDGLDMYIRHILKRNELSRLPVFSNKGILTGRGIKIEFPFSSQTCARCGNCKGERIRAYRQDQEVETKVVFIGDGLSDTCGAHESNLVFAKKDLLLYCEQHQMCYNAFDNFDDILSVLRKQGDLSA
jgi:2,3-diketo-5-methylthio-1-phosphopentane phosphatase